MKKTIYLHVGTIKTGSTAFQHLMRSNYQLLQEEGIFIPKLKTQPKTIPMSEFPNWGLNCIGGEIAKKKSDKNLEFFIQLFEESGCHTAVLSAENLSGNTPDVIAMIARKLKDYKVKPIVVFRHPIALMTSHYCSLSPNRGKINRSPEQFMKNYVANINFIRYGSIVTNYLQLFDNCTVLFFEKETSLLKTLFNKMEFSDILISKLLSDSKSLRISLPPCAASLNQRLSLLCNINSEKYLASIYLNLVAFTRTDEFIKLRDRLFEKNTEILVSGKVQKELIQALQNELQLLANTIPHPIPDSYFNIIDGTLPTDKQIDKIFSKFIQYLSNQNVKNVHSLNHYVLQKNSAQEA